MKVHASLERTGETRPVEIAGLAFPLRDAAALDARIEDVLARRCGGLAVITPNIQHMASLASDPGRRDRYASALLVQDGWPVAALLTLLAGGRRRRITGSDALPRLVSRARERGWTITFLGGAPGVGARCAQLSGLGPQASVELAPPGELDDPVRRRQLVERLVMARPDVLFVGLGYPRQEDLVVELVEAGFSGVALACGASLDFYAGERRRAPRWMRTMGLEWLFRLLSEPARLGPRYASAVIPFLVLVLSSLRNQVTR